MSLGTQLPFPLFTKGKVRDVYDLGENLLIVASDRISAYDSILPTDIPQKGVLLCRMSNFWFRRMEGVCLHHVLSTDVDGFPRELWVHRAVLEGRAVLVKKAKRIDVECVVRGFLAGSGWEEYKRSGTVCGVKLPTGLVESSPLPEPLFTPATKAEQGAHDENISFERMVDQNGRTLAETLRTLSLKIFEEASRHAASRGFLLADTKFEFGFLNNQIILIDELLTPDSSRFWDTASYEAGRPQDSYDKQYVRDYLNKIDWNHEPPAPTLPDDVVARTREKYVKAYERLTGENFI
jgi:phosphoribosylaminoimidazole-succinocarboxamide synthase